MTEDKRSKSVSMAKARRNVDPLEALERWAQAVAAHGEWVARLEQVEQRLEDVRAELAAYKRRHGGGQ